MAVSNGQNADENTFNSAYVSRTQDSDTAGELDLNNANAASGTQITNSQREHNSIASFVGKIVNTAKDLLPTWTNNNTGSPTDDLKTRTEALDANVATTDAALLLKEDKAEKGVADGYAELDSSGRIPLAQMSAEAFTYLGTYNATTNTPTLVDGVGTTADTYRVSVAGTQDFGSGPITFGVGDKVVYNPSAIWEKWDEDPETANRFLSNLDTPTAVNQTLNTQDINVVGEVGINTVPVTDVPLSIQATASANSGIMTWTDSQANDTWEWSVYDNGYLSLIKNGLTVRSLFLTAQGTVGIGNTATSGRFSVAYPADTLQMEIKGDTGQTADLVNFNDSANTVLSSVNADGSSTWPQVDISAEGEVRFQDATGGEYMGLKAPTTVTSSTTLTLPDGAGANGEVLTTNGTDTLSWAAGGGGDLWSDPIDSTITTDGGSYNLGDTTNRMNIGFFTALFAGSGAGNGLRMVGSETMPSGATTTATVRSEAAQNLGIYTIGAAVTDNVYIESGNASAGDSGDISLQTGTATGTRGSIIIKDGTEVSAGAGAVFTQTAADGVGSWQAAAGGGDLWSDPVDSDIVPDGANTRDLGTNGTRFAQAHVDQYRITDGTFKGLIRATAIGMPSGDTTGVLFNARENLRLALYTIDNATADAVATGGVNIETGNKSAGTGDSGDVKLYVGTSLGGSRGKIRIVDGSEGTIGHVFKSDDVNGGGSWQAESGGSPSIRANNTYIQWRNQADSADIDALRMNAANEMELVGRINPTTHATQDFGSGTTRFRRFYASAQVRIGGSSSLGGEVSSSSTMPSTAIAFGLLTVEDGKNIGVWTENNATADAAKTGDAIIETGNKSAGTGNSGNIIHQTGTSVGGSRGSIIFKDGSQAGGGAGAVWTQSAADGVGSWQASASGGATTELDNLGTTAVNADLRMDLTKTVILPNNTYLKSRNNADSADLDMFKVSTGGVIQASGDVLPVSSAVFDLGAAATRWAEVHATTGYLRTIQPTVSGTTTLNLQTASGTGSGGITAKSGNASAGNSGDVRLESGTATGTRGQVIFSARQINHSAVTSIQVVWENGVTGSRPVAPVTGQRYFDTTLGQPIWYDGTNWVDAQGVTV